MDFACGVPQPAIYSDQILQSLKLKSEILNPVDVTIVIILALPKTEVKESRIFRPLQSDRITSWE